MEETVFFNQAGVSVSNARFIVNSQTYAMNGVTSIKQAVNHPSRLGPIVLGFIGFLFLFGSIVLALIFLAAAILWWMNQKPEWFVILSSASGETKALSSNDKTYIDGVINALNQSIIHRG